jgi:TolB-like protein/Flp pilus assembly protein TadD
MSLRERLKKRKIVQWAVAYLAGAWVVMQLVDVLGGRWGISDAAARLIDLVLVLGFFVALVLAWYHGEQGRQRVSGVELLIIAGLFGIGGLLLTQVNVDEAAPEVETTIAMPDESDASPSIAVLPFTIRSDDKQDEYFAAGVHDDLLSKLAKIDGLKVISRTSVMQYVDTTKTMREIAEELGVATVVEGAVQRGGDRIRVTAQLIDAGSDEHIWASNYDEELTAENVFQIQSSLATEIAEALNAELLPDVQTRIEYQPTDNLLAWDLATRARYLLDKGRVQSDLEGAAELFRQSIDEDPDYAPAWSGYSRALIELVSWHYWPEEKLVEAERAANRSIELDASLSDGYIAQGVLYRLQRKYAESEEVIRRALDLSPGAADAYSNYSETMRDTGQMVKAVDAARKSIELGPRVMRIREVLLQNLYFDRQWDAVLQEAKELLELEPGAAYAWYWIAFAHNWLGDRDVALEASRKALEIGGDAPYLASGLAFAYAMAGESESALRMLETAEQEGWPLVEIGLVYAWLPDLDKAFDYMERALDERPTALMYLNTDPAADPMREDPRWHGLQQRLEQPTDHID